MGLVWLKFGVAPLLTMKIKSSCCSIPYVPPILGQILDLISLARTNLFGPDSFYMTHETWKSSNSSMMDIEIIFRTFIKQNANFKGFFESVVLGNLNT